MVTDFWFSALWFEIEFDRSSCCKCTLYFHSVERDAQLLANRIALLKQEEMKTWKKIEETKKRAGEVMRLKERNNIRIAEKMEKMKYDQIVSHQSKQRIMQMRKDRGVEKAKIQQSILMSKHEEAK